MTEDLNTAKAALVDKVPQEALDIAADKITKLEDELISAQQEALVMQHTINRIDLMTPRPQWQDIKIVEENKVTT